MFYYLAQEKGRTALLSLAITIRQLLLVSGAAINANVLTALVGRDLRLFGLQFVYLTFVWTAIIFLDIWTKKYQMALIQDLSILMRETVSKNLTRASFDTFHQKSNGTYVSWLNNDIQTINRQGYEQLFEIVYGVSGALFSVILLVSYHWSLLLVTIIGTLFMLFIPRLFSQKVKEASLNTTIQNERFLSDVEDAVGGYDALLALNYLRLIPHKIYTASLELKKIVLKQTSIEATVNAVGFALNVFLQMIVIALTGLLAFNGIVAIGAIEATGMLASIIFTSLSSLSNQLSAINGVSPIFDKVQSMLEKESSKEIIQKEIDPAQSPLFKAEDLSFQYDNTVILNHLSFDFYEGGKYLMKGESGSGKSTLLRLLSGFLDSYSGKLTFYNQEISTMDQRKIRERVLYVDQQPYLFSDTIRENILLEDNFTDEAILRALEKVGLHPEDPLAWLDTEVGDNGRYLSGGQRQRIALVRGFIRQRDIVLIDEGTSAVDGETAIEIEKQLLTNPNLTVILVTHSPNQETLQYFDESYLFPDDFI